jgi:hypothetical protein
MNALATRQQLIATIEELPAESLSELVIFLEYLRFKTNRVPLKRKKTKTLPNSSFLLAITGLGAAAETNIAERDEEILAAEIDPIRDFGAVR